MRCMPEHSTLVLYAAPPGTDTTALPTLLGADSYSRNRFAVTRCIGGNRNPFDAAQIAPLSPLNLIEAGAASGFPRTPYAGSPVSENILLIGISVNRANPPPTP